MRQFELAEKDIPAIQKGIAENLSRFFSFSTCDAYFPDEPVNEPLLLADEEKLFVPIIWQGSFKGAFLFAGVDANAVLPLLEFLPTLVEMCISLELSQKKIDMDSATGLANEEYFYKYLKMSVDEFHALGNSLSSVHPGQYLHRLCMGMIIIKWIDADDAIKAYGASFAVQILAQLGRHLAQNLPPDAIGALLGRYEGKFEYGIIISAAGSAACEHKTKALLEMLGNMCFEHPLTKRKYYPLLSAGYALYPHDMQGEDLRQPLVEQALRLRDRARLAVEFAAGLKEDNNVIGFGNVLKKGARIVKILPNGNVRINLGAVSNIREGMRFDVIAPADVDKPQIRKGQILVISVESRFSLASPLFVTDESFDFELGDHLRLANEDSATLVLKSSGKDDGKKNDRRILSYQEFFSAFGTRKDKLFVLGITRFLRDSGELSPVFNEEIFNLPETPLLYGIYGSGSMLFYHPERDGQTVRVFYEALSELAGKYEMSCISGLFPWPFLNFGKGESEINAIKALDYGRLLPEPHIGIFDSVAMTIHADKLYSQGEIFGAINEYEQALLVDENNFMAMNSLGVANASLGKFDKARRLFEAALKICDLPGNKAEINYNLGAVYQQLNDYKAAGMRYRQSLRDDPGHAWSWVRLGQLAELNKRRAEAAALYEKAMTVENASQQIKNVAQRQLARLKAKQNENGRAREILHDNLLEDPDNMETLLELAKMYLKNNEDPDMAEVLARKSINRGAGARGWLVLADALEMLGRPEDALQARQTGEQKS